MNSTSASDVDPPQKADEDCGPVMMHGGPIPLHVQVLVAVVLGALAGWAFGDKPIFSGSNFTTQDLGIVAKVIVQQLLTGLAAPLIFFAIIDAFLKTEITGRQGLKLIGICAINVAVAFTIGLTIINYFEPAKNLTTKFPSLLEHKVDPTKEADLGKLSLQETLERDVPRSVVEPFVSNNIMSVVILALITGISLRTLRGRLSEQMALEMAAVERVASGLFLLLMQMLQYVVLLIPIAVFCALAQVVGKNGLQNVLELMGTFLAAILSGMALHALVYYPLVSWLFGGKSVLSFFRASLPAAVTGLSINSSLATVPVTLASLKKLGVSESSSRLSACVGTNFNNDGISLYEAMTALFFAQAFGFELSLGQQIIVMLAALSACLGSAGVPSSGMVILPLVLKATGLPPAMSQAAYTLVLSVDWIAARCRSAVNVMGDITVAILLDAGKKKPGS